MGIVYSVSQHLGRLGLKTRPTNRDELVDRITKLQQNGVGLTQLLIRAQETSGCLMFPSTPRNTSPIDSFYLEFVATFTNGANYSILEEQGHTHQYFFGPWSDRENPMHIRMAEEKGRLVLRAGMSEMENWFKAKGYPVTLERLE